MELELATGLHARGFTWKQEERVAGLTSTWIKVDRMLKELSGPPD